MDDVPSTLTPAKAAEALVAAAVRKHNTRYESTFLKAVRKAFHSLQFGQRPYNDGFVFIGQFSAGVVISFGALTYLIFTCGATGLNQSNPGIVKVVGGFVFPVGLVMYVSP